MKALSGTKNNGSAKPPLLLIHGGAGDRYADNSKSAKVKDALHGFITDVWREMRSGMSAVDAVLRTMELLEASPLFNAGYGSTLQSDGAARLSASLMDGTKQIFSGVSLATQMIHPSRLTRALQTRKHRVIDDTGAQLLARELGMAPESPVSPERAARWAATVGQETGPSYGTVGAVALDSQGRLAAATSTGGQENGAPGRVSDVSTPAGNYSSRFAAISCSGSGEQIIDAGLSVRMECRIRDGMSLAAAAELCHQEAEQLLHKYGWIGLDARGNWVLYFTTELMNAAVIGAELSSPLIVTC